jgi:hypothetical protein
MESINKLSLFWDVSRINPESHEKFIIERILNFGDKEDFQWAMDYYGKDKIVDNLIKSKKLSKKSLLFWCRYFNIDIKQCIGNQLSIKQSAFYNR